MCPAGASVGGQLLGLIFNSYRSIQMGNSRLCAQYFCDSIHAWRPMYNPFELKSSNQYPMVLEKALLAFVVGIGPISARFTVHIFGFSLLVE